MITPEVFLFVFFPIFALFFLKRSPAFKFAAAVWLLVFTISIMADGIYHRTGQTERIDANNQTIVSYSFEKLPESRWLGTFLLAISLALVLEGFGRLA